MPVTTIPVKDPFATGAPSTQEVRLVSNPGANFLTYKIRTDATTGPVRSCLELELPILDGTDFGSDEMPFPPAGTVYFFANSATGNSASIIDSAGTISPVAGATPEFTSLSTTGSASVGGDLEVDGGTIALNNAGTAERIFTMDAADSKGVLYAPTTGKMTIGEIAGGSMTTLEFEALNMKLGTKGGDKIGFFNTTPVVQPTITAAGPGDLAACQTQIQAIKQLLDDLGLCNMV